MTYNADEPCLVRSLPLGYIMKVQKQSLEHILTLPYPSSSQLESSASHQMAMEAATVTRKHAKAHEVKKLSHIKLHP